MGKLLVGVISSSFKAWERKQEKCPEVRANQRLHQSDVCEEWDVRSLLPVPLHMRTHGMIHSHNPPSMLPPLYIVHPLQVCTYIYQSEALRLSTLSVLAHQTNTFHNRALSSTGSDVPPPFTKHFLPSNTALITSIQHGSQKPLWQGRRQ